ncbi:hypothetical protein QBC40DRAFT_312099 [Triangularia verruculosa]|uniref:DUF6594 domain-containing protein n=1 Tax=Triangularia verruculosa TaxID=2587418 RepID=A0AAN6XU50_9PEZI|nr:hypothetical protein QBC40DRAFT_312099 [Triangularia verruculosa]
MASENITEFPIPPDYWERLVANAYEHDNRADLNILKEYDHPALGDFNRLHRLNLTHLFNNLVRIKAEIKHQKTTSSKQMELLRVTLHQYVEAIKDYRYLAELRKVPDSVGLQQRMALEGAFEELSAPYSESPERNAPYNTQYLTISTKTQSSDAVREFLRKVLPNVLSWSKDEREIRPHEYQHHGMPEIYSPFLNALARFLIGTAAGASLVVPMVIMIFQPSLNKSLITVSMAVLLFAFSLAFAFDAKNEVIVTATATYAAVLVVFVGTSSSSGSDSG